MIVAESSFLMVKLFLLYGVVSLNADIGERMKV